MVVFSGTMIGAEIANFIVRDDHAILLRDHNNVSFEAISDLTPDSVSRFSDLGLPKFLARLPKFLARMPKK